MNADVKMLCQDQKKYKKKHRKVAPAAPAAPVNVASLPPKGKAVPMNQIQLNNEKVLSSVAVGTPIPAGPLKDSIDMWEGQNDGRHPR